MLQGLCTAFRRDRVNVAALLCPRACVRAQATSRAPRREPIIVLPPFDPSGRSVRSPAGGSRARAMRGGRMRPACAGSTLDTAAVFCCARSVCAGRQHRPWIAFLHDLALVHENHACADICRGNSFPPCTPAWSGLRARSRIAARAFAHCSPDPVGMSAHRTSALRIGRQRALWRHAAAHRLTVAPDRRPAGATGACGRAIPAPAPPPSCAPRGGPRSAPASALQCGQVRIEVELLENHPNALAHLDDVARMGAHGQPVEYDVNTLDVLQPVHAAQQLWTCRCRGGRQRQTISPGGHSRDRCRQGSSCLRTVSPERGLTGLAWQPMPERLS